jgi:hypothetical protein
MATIGDDEAFLAYDALSGYLMLCAATSPLPREDPSRYAPPASVTKEIFRNRQPFHPLHVAYIMDVSFTQQHAYELLEQLIFMQSSIRTILSSVEKHKHTPITDSNPCVDMLDGDTFETDSELFIAAQDVIRARNSAVLGNLSYILKVEDEDSEEIPPLWPVSWMGLFHSISNDFAGEHTVQRLMG